MEKTQYPPYDTFQKNQPSTVKEIKKTKDKNKCIHNTTYYLQILFSNIGICALLIGYTLLGSFIFLMIEGRSGIDSKQLNADKQMILRSKLNKTQSIDWKQSSEEFRTRTVENIWEITAALNILYRENWTRLAGQEISRFQDELVQKLTEEILNSKGSSLERNYQMEWNFSRAFLYSLTILTTIEFSTKQNLKRHTKTCHDDVTKYSADSSHWFCFQCDCKFYRANLLKSHYKNAHNIVIKEEILEFPSYANFLNWKESEEERTFSYFPKANREKWQQIVLERKVSNPMLANRKMSSFGQPMQSPYKEMWLRVT